MQDTNRKESKYIFHPIYVIIIPEQSLPFQHCQHTDITLGHIQDAAMWSGTDFQLLFMRMTTGILHAGPLHNEAITDLLFMYWLPELQDWLHPRLHLSIESNELCSKGKNEMHLHNSTSIHSVVNVKLSPKDSLDPHAFVPVSYTHLTLPTTSRV